MAALSGKVALVTGSSRGIGRAIAERLAADGAQVVVHASGHSADQAAATAAAIGEAAIALTADLAQEAEVERLVRDATARLGRLDILVNNAGVALYKPVAELTAEDFDRVFAVNARGTFLALKHGAAALSDGGRIVSISTGGTRMASPGGSIYAGSKAAVEQFSGALAKELGPRGITVNVVAPGFTDTDMLGDNPEMREMGAKLSPFGRIGKPEEVAVVVAFLASPDAGWVTGQIIGANGGVV